MSSLLDSKMTTFHKILQLLTTKERKATFYIIFLMFIGMLLETLGIGLIVPAIAFMTQSDWQDRSSLTGQVIQYLGNPDQSSLVIMGLSFLVAVYLVKAIFLSYLIWKQTSFAFNLQASLSMRLFRLYLQQPYIFHLQRNSAQLIRNVMTEVNVFTFSAILPLLMFLSEIFVFAGLLVLLLVIEPLGTLTVIGVIGGITSLFYFLTKSQVTLWGELRQTHDGMRLQHLQQGLGGIKDVKLLNRASYFLEQYAVHNDASAKMGEKQKTLSQLPRIWLELIAVCGLVLLVIVLLLNDQKISSIIPTIGLFAAAAFRLLPSITRILGSLQGIRYGIPVVDVLYNELNQLKDEGVSEDFDVLHFSKQFELKGVHFTYENATTPALSDINIGIHKGETVGFIGGSGAGKSTLIDILLGLLHISSGEIFVDGQILNTHLSSWQKMIGYVPQSIFLTDDTLRRNIAFGIDDECIDENRIKKALNDAQLTEFIEQLPDGLDTIVGERGVRLSGGQIQRIGICRALYHQPQILVLDEATSALDVDTEAGVMEAIRQMHGDKTIIIVAHRLSTVQQCDRIYRLEKGRIISEGTASQMLA